jgi:hypothetical protein
LFAAISRLLEILREIQFDKYAQIKSQGNEVFRQYPVFMRILSEMAALECAIPCREGGGSSTCKIKRCVLEKAYAGCWDCDARAKCGLLEPLYKVHPHLEYHLGLIKKEGLQNWGVNRKQHYCFNEDSFLHNDCPE